MYFGGNMREVVLNIPTLEAEQKDRKNEFDVALEDFEATWETEK